MKKKLIILIISFVMALSCISFSGFPIAVNHNLFNSANSSTLRNDDGDILEEVTYSLDEEKLNENNLDFSVLSLQLLSVVKNELQTMYDDYLFRVRSKMTEAIISKDTELADRYEELLEEAKIYEPVWDGYNLICKSQFNSSSAYCIFYNITETLFDNYEKVKDTFITKYYYKTTSDIALNQGMYSVVKNCIENKTLIEFTPNLNTTFSYLARSKRYHSNANTISTTTDGYYLHTWNIDNSLENQEMYFYLKVANRSVWFAVAILISLCLSIFLTIIALIFILANKIKTKK